jgi:hypothetical protein
LKAKYINPYTDFGFKKLFGEEANKEIANFDEKELSEYEESLKHYRDLKGVIDTSFEEGEKVGYDKKAREMAKAMKIKGYSLEEISELTQIPEEEIEKL